jgi:hypothetical protein
MKEERGLIEAAQPEGERRIRKYMRIALVSGGMALFLTLIVMAVLRRYGG